MRKSMILGLMAAFLLLTVAVVNLTGGGSADISGITPGEKGSAYASFFNSSKDKVIDLHINLPQNAWIEMLVNAHERKFYSADIEINGQRHESAGFRIKSGMPSSNPQSLIRYSFKIKFNRFINGKSFHGLDELNLINNFGDPSFMREYLMLEAMRESGMPAPLAVYINLYINGRLHGLYLGVEAVDSSFLARNFGDALGNLFRADRHASLLLDMHPEAFSHRQGDDINRTELARLTRILNAMPLGQKGEIESVLDVDSALKYIAANAVFGNFGSYLGGNARDYFLYHNNGVFTVIAHEVHTSFGAHRDDYGISADVSAARPLLNINMAQRPLAAKLLAVPEYNELYEQHIKEFTELLKNAESRISELNKVLLPYIEADPTKFYTAEHYNANINGTGNMSILTYIKKRLEFLTKN